MNTKLIQNGWKFFTDPDYRFRKINRLGLYKNMDDVEFLKRNYSAIMKKPLNLENPQTYNEKLQWLKLYDHNPAYTKMVDKYEAKKYVADLIGEEYIIPTLGVWDSFDEIDFAALPNQFVLKCTHDSGGLVICRDKSKLDMKKARKKITHSLNQNFYYRSREWPYKNVKPRIIAEAYMENGEKGLIDYKFFNFNGKPEFLYMSEGLENHSTARISFYDLAGNEMPFRRRDYKGFEVKPAMPENLDEMKRFSALLAEKIQCPFVRTDFYSVQGKVYFSEITFYPNSGCVPFEPEEWDKKLGDWILLPGNK